MIKRIITGLIALAILIPLLVFSGTFVFPVLLAIVTVICLFEMFRCMGIHKKYDITMSAYTVAVIVPFFMRYIDNKVSVAKLCFVVGIMYLITVFASMIWSHGRIQFNDSMTIFVITAYIIGSINSIIFVRDFEDVGQYVYMLIFFGAWMTDTFAYFAGYFFGKHKLIADVSPKKTVEGSVGGILGCILSFIAYGLIVDIAFERTANIWFLALMGFIASVVAQIGDLLMSVIKRHYGVKDYGTLFPGHGGMLDRLDSVLTVALGMAAVCMVADVFEIQLF
ncbi:MAG: phosphatidate cytidylyltransferase [Ruminococcaceae bacterium]|nr:phosphatidate cytidylyltransferase [Oscillospiraceae bacterium]